MNIELLKQLRIEKGLKQREVAEVIGVGRNAYLYYEQGKIDPPFSRMKKLADLYGVSLDDLA